MLAPSLLNQFHSGRPDIIFTAMRVWSASQSLELEF